MSQRRTITQHRCRRTPSDKEGCRCPDQQLSRHLRAKHLADNRHKHRYKHKHKDKRKPKPKDIRHPLPQHLQ